MPTNAFQFGGFIAGSSRNGNATPHKTEYNYVKEKETGQGVTGWRVFDIEGVNVTLISAGNPEDYYHNIGDAYQSEYILTGNINSAWENGETEAEKYQKRDWSIYVNEKQKATSAIPLTMRRLNSWYSKYTNTPNADTWNETTFRKIYQEPSYIKYQNMVENYSYYWLSIARNSYGVWAVDPFHCYVRNLSHNTALGVRLLVSLSPDVKFTSTKTGTKTLHGGNMDTHGGEQTYNVWGIQ